MISDDELRTLRERMQQAQRREDAAAFVFGQLFVMALMGTLIYLVYRIVTVAQ